MQRVYPELWVEDADYGDDTTTEEEEYDPVMKTYIGLVTGELDDYNANRYYDAPITGGSHCTFHDGGATKWHDYHQPPSPAEPACYTKNKHVRVRAKFWASENLTYNTQVYVDVAGVDWLTFTEDTSENFWSWPSESTFHNSDGLLEDTIGSTAPNFAWTYKVPSGTNQWIAMASQSGPHKIYRVYGAPECGSSNYTEDNLDGAVGKALGGTTEADTASKANDNVGDAVFHPGGGCICEDGFQKNFDAAMGNYPASPPKGMCCCRAEGLDCVLNVLGIGPYTHDYVNEIPEPNPSKLIYGSHCDICGEDVDRCYWDGFWNNWAGVIKAGGTGSTCYDPANGSISIDEGTYSEIDSKIASDCGYYWIYGENFGDTCPHLEAP